MKIACISNSNNFFSTLTQYLRDEGLDVTLLVMPNEGQDTFHHPSADCFDDSWKEFTKEISWGDSSSHTFIKSIFTNKIKNQIKEDLKPYDFLIGTQLAPAYCKLVGRKLNIQFPMGADTRIFPHYNFFKKGYIKPNRLEHNYRAYFQKEGIRESEYVISGLNARDQLLLLKPKGIFLDLCVPAFYEKHFSTIGIETKSIFYEKFKAIRESCDIMVFSQNRQWWWGYGNEILIKGLHLFVQKYPNENIKVVMFEYGHEIHLTKALIAELSLEKYIAWMPPMPRKELILGLKLADIGANELSQSWVMAGSIFECFALGKPLIQYREDDQYKHLFNELPPILNAHGEEAVFYQLEQYLINKEQVKEVGNQSKKWYQEQVINKSILSIVDIIKKKS